MGPKRPDPGQLRTNLVPPAAGKSLIYHFIHTSTSRARLQRLHACVILRPKKHAHAYTRLDVHLWILRIRGRPGRTSIQLFHYARLELGRLHLDAYLLPFRSLIVSWGVTKIGNKQRS